MTLKPVDTAIVMVVGPAIDDTDFKSLEESIAYNAAGMDISLIVEKTDGTSAVTAITLTTGGTSDWTHKDGGYYEVEITAAQNAEEGVAYVRGVCTGVLPFESVHYDIVKANIYDSLIKGTDKLHVDVTQLLGTAWLTPGVAGTPDVNAKLIGATAQTGRDIGASVLLSTGTGAGQLDFTAGIVKSNLTQILAHLLTQTGTQLADGFEHFFDVATPTGTVDSLPAAAPDAAGGLPISDAGNLDLDTKLANTNEITAARMGALTDWINGGRLDAILDLCAVEANIEGHVNSSLSAYNGPTDTEMIAAFTEIKGATWAAGTDTLEHIRNKQTDIETDTGTTIPGTITTLQTDVTAIDVLTESGGSGDLAAIKTQVDAILDLERESGVVTVTDAETTLYEDASPTKNKSGVVVKIDMAALVSGDTFVVKEKYKDENGGSYQVVDELTYSGAQDNPLRIVELTPYRYGAIITMQRTAGTNRSIEWESFVEE